MRDHTIFAVVLLVFAVGFYSFTSGSPTGQAYGVYSVGEYYDGPVNTFRTTNTWSESGDFALLGNPLRVKSMFDGEINLDRATVELCVGRALQNAHQASYEEAKFKFRLTRTCKDINPADLDVDSSGFLDWRDVILTHKYYSKSGYTKVQKNEINQLLLCSASNEGKRIWSGAYKRYLECTNLKGYPGFMFLTMDLFGYV